MHWGRVRAADGALGRATSFEILGHIEDLTTEILFRTLGGTPREARLAREARRLATEAEVLVARRPHASRRSLILRAHRLQGLYGDLGASPPGGW